MFRRDHRLWVYVLSAFVCVMVLGQQCVPPPDVEPMPGTGQSRATLQTSEGVIVVELFDRQAPLTVAHFLQLVEDGFYSQSAIHEVQDGSHISGGLFSSASPPARLPEADSVENESNNGLSNLRGRLVMIEPEGPGSGTSGFRILLADQPSNDFDLESDTPGRTVFGKVVAGMDVVDTIGSFETESVESAEGQTLSRYPTPPVLIGQIVAGEEDLPPAEPPVEGFEADAGDDRVVAAGLDITLDGGGSSAGEAGGALSFAWEQIAGPTVELSDPSSEQPSFTVPDGAESLSFRLTVTNDLGTTATDEVVFPVAQDPHVRMQTSEGDILFDVFEEETPITATNFLQYIVDDYYDGTIFHRVPENFVIQGGGFLPGLVRQEPLRDPIVNEFSEDRPNLRGTIAMAKTSDPDSATSQFFFNTKDNPDLDNTSNSGGFTVFGNIEDGLDVMDAIQAVETETVSTEEQTFQDVPVEDVVVLDVVIEDAPDPADDSADEDDADPGEGEDEGTDEDTDEVVPVDAEFTVTEEGLQYRDVALGDGAVVQPESTIRVIYEGRFDDENGDVFDTSLDEASAPEFPLSELIEGWQIGLGEIEMREGGTRQLIIPPDLAYGDEGSGAIPPNATLWFQISIVEIVN